MDKKKNLIYGIILMLSSSVFTCMGQLCWKLAVVRPEKVLFYAVGLGLYGVGAVVMIVAFRFGEMSILHPMLSFGYVLSLLLGIFVLKETVTIKSVVGVVLILIGMVFLSRTPKEVDE